MSMVEVLEALILSEMENAIEDKPITKYWTSWTHAYELLLKYKVVKVMV
jgi:hypothetical protein